MSSRAHALCVTMPEMCEALPLVNEVRRLNDKAFSRWPPHLSLCWPFYPRGSDGYRKAIQYLRDCGAFEMRFRSVGPTNGREEARPGKGKCKTGKINLGLLPDQETSIVLQNGLDRALGHDEVAAGEFQPHLTCGTWGPGDYDKGLKTLQNILDAAGSTIRFHVESLDVLGRASDDKPFVVMDRIRLGQ